MGLIKSSLTAILVFTFMMAGANKVSDQVSAQPVYARRGLAPPLLGRGAQRGSPDTRCHAQIHPETHAFLSKGFATFGPKVWAPLLKEGVKAAGQEEKLPMLELLLLDDGSGTYKKFMTNVGGMEITCAVIWRGRAPRLPACTQTHPVEHDSRSAQHLDRSCCCLGA
jgi:hypothetical protein